MKKIITFFIYLFFLSLSSILIILSTIGLETKKFNNLISEKIIESNKNINLRLNSIKFKLDVKELSLFLETINPSIKYRENPIQAKNLRVYIDFISILKSTVKIKKIDLSLEEMDIKKLKTLSTSIKPSNLKSILTNKVKQGIISVEIEFYFDEKNQLNNFISKGTITDLNLKIYNDLIITKTNFNFFADNTDVLITKIFGELNGVKIKEGDLKIALSPEISLESNFITNIKLKKQTIDEYDDLTKKIRFINNMSDFEADLNNYLSLNIDKTFKLKNFNYETNGKINNVNFNFKKPIQNNFIENKIVNLKILNSDIQLRYNTEGMKTNLSGKYTLNNKKELSYSLTNNIKKDISNINLEIDIDEVIDLEFINYRKPNNLTANLILDVEKKKNYLKFKKIDFKENNNFIFFKNLNFIKNKFSSFEEAAIKTFSENKNNNDFKISFTKQVSLTGNRFDASNLAKFFSRSSKANYFKGVNKEINVDLKNIIIQKSDNLKNFKLIGFIRNGKFVKISSKGDFGNNKFLDISMKSDNKNKKKFIEIYSDFPKPLLTEYSFFKDLSEGKLLYTSIIEDTSSNSKLIIEDFRVINAPGMVKLLSLADLGGLADLASGEGLSFDTLEIKMSSDNDFVKFEEIYAVGPSISVLMEGYKDENGLTSLSGTLVPAKNLNKLISQIPVLGDIIIPKEVGEGLFGISFKMKGMPGKIKTSINPIKTVTPRFIQKILKKNKNENAK